MKWTSIGQLVERKLLAWSELFRKGEQLRVDLRICYIDSDKTITTASCAWTNPNFLIKQGVKRGIARRFVSDIEDWAKRRKQDNYKALICPRDKRNTTI